MSLTSNPSKPRSALRRLGLAVLGGAVGLTGTLAAAPAANAAAEDSSASWLAGQLQGGLMYNPQFGGFNDYGLTADTGFALADVGGQPRAVRQLRNALQRNVDSWTTGVDFGSSDIYAGSTAKALVIAEETGVNPRRFGGRNLVRRMSRLVLREGATEGRIRDRSEADYANTIGQGFAVQGLRRANSPLAGAATRYLLEQQCDGGFFRLYFLEESAPDQSCGADGTPDLDATALTVLSLQALPRQGKAVRGAIGDATAWMVSVQEDDGSFGGGPSTSEPNSNSTGLAAWALGQARFCRPAAKAARWVNQLRFRSGAIAYDQAAYDQARDSGITRQTRDQFRRATSQAAPGLTYGRLRACRS